MSMTADITIAMTPWFAIKPAWYSLYNSGWSVIFPRAEEMSMAVWPSK